ncbi:TIGR04540 family protein [Bacillus cereus group sp. BceL221]|uniref:TIGR04540 family protein n=1 Tax=unclassified Bacillus cereus group TaxID=2750818 RepID=UPI0022E2B99A|nr:MULTISPECIES: TIGR04540 family protein [unclassified Bacillus cereus group]MDA2196948.1 TIGR04540 family protein [Bacillus cereus group sp. Bc238]MDA2202675.1 TIGR04540 family protein [Bacillus cereus group sp. Bc237]
MIKLFYRTQRELATALNQLVDSYWKEEIEEQELIDGIHNMYENNMYKLRKGNGFTKIVEQQCGKRRLEVVKQILRLD